jgi:hypothetical protein
MKYLGLNSGLHVTEFDPVTINVALFMFVQKNKIISVLKIMPRKCSESIKVKFLAILDYEGESSALCAHLQKLVFRRLQRPRNILNMMANHDISVTSGTIFHLTG